MNVTFLNIKLTFIRLLVTFGNRAKRGYTLPGFWEV